MYHTPTKMVSTRSASRKEREQKETQGHDVSKDLPQTEVVSAHFQAKDSSPKKNSCASGVSASSSKKVPLPTSKKSKDVISRRSSTSSLQAQRRRLELEAAEKKAKIQMDLIEKKLQADIADLHDMEYSSHEKDDEVDKNSRDDIEQWLDRSQQELITSKLAPEHGHETGQLRLAAATRTPHRSRAASPAHPPPPPAPDVCAPNDTFNLLASAIKNLTTASAQNSLNANLLSRISTPRDLPDFSGEPVEWLQFKRAYEESTEVCKFSEKENLWRLRKCLKGAAKEAVAAVLISATSPDKIMATLALRFGNPDYIIFKIVQDIKKLQPMSQDYQKEIVPFSVKIQNFVEAVRSVEREEYLQGMSIVSIILSKLPAVLLSKWSDYSYTLITEGKKSRLIILADFLNHEAVKVSATANIYLTSAKTDYSKSKQTEVAVRPHTVLLQNEERESKCKFCRVSVHKLTYCNAFKRALRKVRWQYVKRNGICYKCLQSRHDRQICTAPECDKDGCGQAHHRLLHYTNKYNSESDNAAGAGSPQVPGFKCSQPPAPAAPSPPPAPAEAVIHINDASECKVLLKVVPIRIYGPNGVVNTSALLDDGSTVSLISARLAERAGLRGRRETMRVCGAWTGNLLVCEATVITVNLSGMDDKLYSVKVRSVNELNLPVQNLSSVNYKDYVNLMDIKNKLCNVDVKPEMIIGQDNFHLMLPIEVKLGKRNEPSATLTPLGWCIHGSVRAPPSGHAAAAAHSALLISTIDSAAHDDRLMQDLHDEVRRSFALDSLGVSGKPRVNADDARAVAQLERTAVLIEGRWQVGLPWKEDAREMPDAYSNALKRLKGVERKMTKDEGYAARYEERVNHLFTNDFAKQIFDTSRSPTTWYLPHFGVDNPNKKKLRLVFDAADTTEGMCLNDYLLKGPDLLASLFGVMLRFRENAIAVTGDIKDMFLRIKIRPEDQDALRFLWRTSRNPTAPVNTYVMTSLIFGANCSPFVAQFIKNKNAKRYESSQRAAVDAICHSHYMDDYIQSLPDEKTAIEMVSNVTKIHRSGGFEIRNWTSNSVAVLNSVPTDTLANAAVKFKIGQQYEGERTLGLIWYPNSDELGFDVSLKRIPESIIGGKERPTKRLMLRVIMSIFDVFGFLSPFTIQGRIMLQDTWRSKVGWDDNIPDDIYDKWCQWIDLLGTIHKVRIPRCYHMAASGSETGIHAVSAPASPFAAYHGTTSATTERELDAASTSATKPNACATQIGRYSSLQLHVFSDASTKAICAVGYWRWVNEGDIHVTFIASKCRVLPVKSVTVPRAELQAALLAARLASSIEEEHKIAPTQRYMWCDSTTVLHWIRNDKRTYKTFVANRLGEIDELTRAHEWRYVPTGLNVADLATREVFDYSVFQGEWLHGPKFLHDDETSWPVDVINSETEDTVSTEWVTVINNYPRENLPVPDPERFSSWLRLLRSTTVVLKFINKCKRLTGDIDCQTMDRAENLLLRHAQAQSFHDDITALKAGKDLPQNSRLHTLSPLIDSDGVLRAGGRIDAASDVSLEVKRPIILDGKHHVARLIVRHFHVKAAHGNQETKVNELKQRYWIINLRPTVKNVVSRCMLCRIRKCKPLAPRMGDLPQARMAHHQRPFTHCGLDLFGPMDVTVCRHREKRYGVLFTCLTVRAVHIELVNSLTSDSLIMALRRMAARRGWPRHLYSDNGTNLRGADTELRKSMLELDNDVLKNQALNYAVQWHFIPPASPHWGGAWERLIRSVKTSLRVILTERAPKDEVLSTLMAEVENIVNSRPLMHVSVTPGDVETLTPNHFLLGSSSNLPVSGGFDESDLHRKKLWRKSQALTDMYWRRWVKEILPELLPRKKWHRDQKPLQVGDLVLIVDPSTPRNVWAKGVIEQVFPGKDGRVRLVDVKTRTDTLRRSAARVAPISVTEEC